MAKQNGARGVADAMFAELRRAVTDIRENLVERGWFGRPLRDPPSDFSERLGWRTPEDGLSAHTAGFDEQWAPRERSPEPAAPERGDIGIEH